MALKLTQSRIFKTYDEVNKGKATNSISFELAETLCMHFGTNSYELEMQYIAIEF